MENFNNEVSGIYKIENNINNKIYIGKAKNILKRWKAHKGFERKRYPNKTLYKAFDKYGIENFDFSIIEKCDEEEFQSKIKYAAFRNMIRGITYKDIGGIQDAI